MRTIAKTPRPKVAAWFSLVVFSHTVFAMPFAVIGYFLAIKRTEVQFSLPVLGLVILCMIFARTAAMGFNRYIDRKFDAANERTATREIPAGIISPAGALWLVVIMSALFIATTWFINPVC
ncbi:MAG TPA: UbiA family prenyltransferase, partial [Bacteroidia bacterium]|nr:UbiA family prenyltransferase [Bacteroidia bacterium]